MPGMQRVHRVALGLVHGMGVKLIDRFSRELLPDWGIIVYWFATKKSHSHNESAAKAAIFFILLRNKFDPNKNKHWSKAAAYLGLGEFGTGKAKLGL